MTFGSIRAVVPFSERVLRLRRTVQGPTRKSLVTTSSYFKVPALYPLCNSLEPSELCDDHQGCDSGDESNQSSLSQLGHCLQWQQRLRSASSRRMAGQDRPTRRSGPGGTTLSATRQ